MPWTGHAEDLGVNNRQFVIRPQKDRSSVVQQAAPGSHDNVQGAIVSSTGVTPNLAIQSTSGAGNVQSVVQHGGSGNVAIQRQGGAGNRQSIIQTGSGNRASQSQGGQGRTELIHQRGGESGTQSQD
jgi:hypothetical protein